MTPRRIVVTGAGGFVGGRLAARLLQEPAYADARFTFADQHLLPIADHRVTIMEGDISDPAHVAAIISDGVDTLFHLAGILGGAAETDAALARRVNLDATLDLIDLLRASSQRTRMVFASSVAVFGPPMGAQIDDDTLPYPSLIYGAHKRMIEIAIDQASARGWIDGIALRLPGIVAREDADERLRSAFLSLLFIAVREGRDFTMPVPPNGASWLVSVETCVEALLHAATVLAADLGRGRTLTLPALHVRMNALAEAAKAHFPDSASRISYNPDPAITAQFADYPPLLTLRANALGFVHDGSIDRLVARATRPISGVDR